MTPVKEWLERALCNADDADHIWFPADGQDITAAQRICLMCPVRRECLDYALAHDVNGVWGGTTDQQRQRLRATA